MSSDTQLNTRIANVLIPHEICPVGITWPDCSYDFELIADEHDIGHVFHEKMYSKCMFLREKLHVDSTSDIDNYF